MRHSLVVPGVSSAASVACESLVVREGEVVVKALEVLVVGKTAKSSASPPATQHHESQSQDSHFARSSVFCQTLTLRVRSPVELSSSLRSLLS